MKLVIALTVLVVLFSSFSSIRSFRSVLPTPSPSLAARGHGTSSVFKSAALITYEAEQQQIESNAKLDSEIIGLAAPAVAGLLIDPFLSVVDTGYIARLGTTSLAACGPCTSVFQFAWAIPRALSLSTVTLVASALAAQTNKYGPASSTTDIGDHRDVAQVSLSLAIFYGILTMGILTAFGPQVLAIMGAPIGSKIVPTYTLP